MTQGQNFDPRPSVAADVQRRLVRAPAGPPDSSRVQSESFRMGLDDQAPGPGWKSLTTDPPNECGFSVKRLRKCPNERSAGQTRARWSKDWTAGQTRAAGQTNGPLVKRLACRSNKGPLVKTTGGRTCCVLEAVEGEPQRRPAVGRLVRRVREPLRARAHNPPPPPPSPAPSLPYSLLSVPPLCLPVALFSLPRSFLTINLCAPLSCFHLW